MIRLHVLETELIAITAIKGLWKKVKQVETISDSLFPIIDKTNELPRNIFYIPYLSWEYKVYVIISAAYDEPALLNRYFIYYGYTLLLLLLRDELHISRGESF